MYSIFFDIAGEGHVFLNEPMKKHTTFRIGGAADCYIKSVSNEVTVNVAKCCKENNIPLFIIGNGSNILVGDEGIRGVVLQLDAVDAEIEVDEETNYVTASAGILLSKLASLSAKRGLSGLECVSGIPGTLGGALYMNAGAYGDEISNHVVSVTFLDEDLEVKTFSKEDCCFGYRKSIFTNNNKIVLSAILKLSPD